MSLDQYNFIIEGCDNTGKTTLVDNIVRHNPTMTRRKFNAPSSREEAERDYRSLVAELNSSRGLVLDRGPLGEAVYGPIKRGYYPEYMRDLEASIEPHTVLVLLYGRADVIQSRHDGLFITEAEIPVVLDKFHDEFNKSNYQNRLAIDITERSPLDVYRTFERFADGFHRITRARDSVRVEGDVR